jgi:hypothetical protein
VYNYRMVQSVRFTDTTYLLGFQRGRNSLKNAFEIVSN